MKRFYAFFSLISFVIIGSNNITADEAGELTFNLEMQIFNTTVCDSFRYRRAEPKL